MSSIDFRTRLAYSSTPFGQLGFLEFAKGFGAQSHRLDADRAQALAWGRLAETARPA